MRQRARAFTLIELLVVIVLLGILVSVAVLSVGGSSTSRELRDEARRLAALIGVLSDEAVLDSREYGLLVNSEGYRVLRYDPQRAALLLVLNQDPSPEEFESFSLNREKVILGKGKATLFVGPLKPGKCWLSHACKADSSNWCALLTALVPSKFS